MTVAVYCSSTLRTLKFTFNFSPYRWRMSNNVFRFDGLRSIYFPIVSFTGDGHFYVVFVFGSMVEVCFIFFSPIKFNKTYYFLNGVERLCDSASRVLTVISFYVFEFPPKFINPRWKKKAILDLTFF